MTRKHMWAVVLSVALSLSVMAQTRPIQSQAKTTSVDYLHGPFVLKNPKSLGAGFSGHSIKEVIAVLEKSSPAPKSEFETTSQYEARVSSFDPEQQQYIFVLPPPDDDDSTESEAGVFTYNADKQVFTRTIKMFAENGVGSTEFELRSDVIPTGQYVGTNAFNVKRIVHRFEKRTYKLRVTDKSEFFEEEVVSSEWMHRRHNWFIRISLPVKTVEAVTLKNNLRIALMCAVGAWRPVPIDEEGFAEATITHPIQVHLHTKILPVRIDKLLVFDRSNGHILATIGE